MRKILLLVSILGLQTLYAQNALSVLGHSPSYVSIDTTLSAQFKANSTVKRAIKETALQGKSYNLGYYKRESFIKRLFGKSSELMVQSPTNTTKHKSVELAYIAHPNSKQEFWIRKLHFRMRAAVKNMPVELQLVLIPVGVKGERVGTNILRGKTYTINSSKGLKSIDISEAYVVIPPGGVLVGLYDPHAQITLKMKSMENSKGWAAMSLDDKRLLLTQDLFYNEDLFDKAYTPMFGLSATVITSAKALTK